MNALVTLFNDPFGGRFLVGLTLFGVVLLTIWLRRNGDDNSDYAFWDDDGDGDGGD